MTEQSDQYLILLSDIRDCGMVMAALRREKKPDKPGEKKPTPARANEIDAHLRVLEVMERHLNARKTYFIAQLMIAAAGVPHPSFDGAATAPVGERIRELAEEMNIDLRHELAPWIA